MTEWQTEFWYFFFAWKEEVLKKQLNWQLIGKRQNLVHYKHFLLCSTFSSSSNVVQSDYYFICQKLITALWSFWREIYRRSRQQRNSTTKAAQSRVGGRRSSQVTSTQEASLSLSQPLHNKNCYLQAFPLKLWEHITWWHDAKRMSTFLAFWTLLAVAMNENFCKAKARLI